MRTVAGGNEENPKVSWGMRERSRECRNARGNAGTLEGMRERLRERRNSRGNAESTGTRWAA